MTKVTFKDENISVVGDCFEVKSWYGAEITILSRKCLLSQKHVAHYDKNNYENFSHFLQYN